MNRRPLDEIGEYEVADLIITDAIEILQMVESGQHQLSLHEAGIMVKSLQMVAESQAKLRSTIAVDVARSRLLLDALDRHIRTYAQPDRSNSDLTNVLDLTEAAARLKDRRS